MFVTHWGSENSPATMRSSSSQFRQSEIVLFWFFFADVENFLLLLWSNFQLRVESFSGPFWFCVTQLCDCSKSSRLFLNQSDLETEAGRELATSVFPRFQQFTFLIVSSHLAMRT